MVLKFKKSKYQNRCPPVSWELKLGVLPLSGGWEPHTGFSHWWERKLPLGYGARVQLSEQEDWAFPKISTL